MISDTGMHTNPSRRARHRADDTRPRFYLISCEHGGNRIPAHFQDLFLERGSLLRTHRGYDMGALRMARDFAGALSAPLLVSTISRLLIDLNRSPGHPKLYSDATRSAPADVRQEIFARHYLPYRDHAEEMIAQAIAYGAHVTHLSSHSFTPELDGKRRDADVGLLYDPTRMAEADLCRRWKIALQAHAPHMKTRLNYPYTGTSDGFTVYLRRRFPAEDYLGIELELNQTHVLEGGAHWRYLRAAVLAAFLETVGFDRPASGH